MQAYYVAFVCVWCTHRTLVPNVTVQMAGVRERNEKKMSLVLLNVII